MGFSPSNHVLALDAPQTVPLFRLRARDPCPEQHPTEGPTRHTLPISLLKDTGYLYHLGSSAQHGHSVSHSLKQ